MQSMQGGGDGGSGGGGGGKSGSVPCVVPVWTTLLGSVVVFGGGGGLPGGNQGIVIPRLLSWALVRPGTPPFHPTPTLPPNREMKYANSAAVAGEIGPHGNMILNPGRFTG